MRPLPIIVYLLIYHTSRSYSIFLQDHSSTWIWGPKSDPTRTQTKQIFWVSLDYTWNQSDSTQMIRWGKIFYDRPDPISSDLTWSSIGLHPGLTLGPDQRTGWVGVTWDQVQSIHLHPYLTWVGYLGCVWLHFLIFDF